MKTASDSLLALLATGDFVRADIWTITLNGGGIVRWTSHDQSITYGGHTFAQGPLIERSTISEKVGMDVATLDLDITADDSDLINGVPILNFIEEFGLDGASVKLERAYAPDWSSAITGTLIRFAGKVTSVNSIQGATAKVTVSSWLVLLNAASPRNVYQAGCMRTVYDAGCALDPASFQASGTVTTGGAQSFVSDLTGVADRYTQGRLVFTSGANAGLSRSVKKNLSDGTMQLIRPLPVAAAPGDTFTANWGCDRAQATCLGKFNNLLRFKGTPYVPLPSTSLGGAATTTTTGGGKG